MQPGWSYSPYCYRGPTSGLAEPGDFFLQNAEVTPAVDFSGPITVTIGGSEGLTGTSTLATVAAGVTAAASSADRRDRHESTRHWAI